MDTVLAMSVGQERVTAKVRTWEKHVAWASGSSWIHVVMLNDEFDFVLVVV